MQECPRKLLIKVKIGLGMSYFHIYPVSNMLDAYSTDCGAFFLG